MTVANTSRQHAPRIGPHPAGPQLTTATAFAALASDLATASGLDQVLDKVLEFAVTGVHCDWATIELRPTKRCAAITVAYDPRVAQTGTAQLVDDHERTGADTDSVHVVELAIGGTALGAIIFSTAHPNRLTAADLAAAKLLTVHAALAITAVRNAAELSEAIDTRTVIAQAQGIVMERLGVDGEEAFGLLRRCSQDKNLKLRDVARGVVVTRQLPGDQSRPGPRRPGRV